MSTVDRARKTVYKRGWWIDEESKKMRGIRGGEKGKEGERTGPSCYRCIRAKPYSLPFPLPLPFPHSLLLFHSLFRGSNQLRQLSSEQNHFGTTRYRSSRNGAAVILHLLDPFAVHTQIYVYMYIYPWPELTFAYQEQKSDNASATFLFSLE